MRILWLSNAPWASSGYGQQTKMFSFRIADAGHDMAVQCTFGLEGGIINFGKVVCYPKRFHAYGNDVVVAHYQNHKADLLISLIDTWVMNPEEWPRLALQWAAWYPIDHGNLPTIIRNKLSQAQWRIAMSKFGQKIVQEAGLPSMYVPHGVDTKLFKPGDKNEARERVNLPKDKYIIGTVAMNKGNPSRKNFVEMLTAFKGFHARHPDSVYFLQTYAGADPGDWVNLPELCTNLGLKIGTDVIFCHQYYNYLGFPPDYMAAVYNALDVHVLVSAGEGFGIPILEAQACGCPVIVGDWTAMSELCFSGIAIDKKDAEPIYTGIAGYQYRPHIGAIENAMEVEFKHPSPRDRAARLAAEYDADLVTENYWKPVLAQIEADIKESDRVQLSIQ